MKVARYFMLGGALLILAGLMLVSVASVVAQDEAPNPLGEPPTFLLPIYEAWVESPHADVTAEAFNHWNEEADKVIPPACATCHSTSGYQDYLGADGTEAGVVDNPAPLGSVVNCDACHNSASISLTAVTFPSGVEITNLGDDSRCMVCHQGRSSTDSVNAAIEKLNLTAEPNTASADLGFINIHYYAAAASLYGAEVRGGYQFEGKTYQPRNDHVEGYNTCISCHDPHTLELKLSECATCHEDVETVEDVRDIRMNGSMIDYDGDGDDFEGIRGEIETLQAMLMEAIQMYAAEVAGTPIVYSNAAYPYFFIDTNGNGSVDEGEAAFPNKYNAFTPVLLQAAYNYQVSQKDPGGYTHNPKYHIELLYDSIEALNAQMGGDGVDLSTAWRNDPGHFDATAESFRHWDADGEVPGACARCHTDGGLAVYLKNGVNIAAAPSRSLQCSTCHDAIPEFTVYPLTEATFPSGAKVSFGEEEPDNLCLNCHQGRESTVSVNRAISAAGVGPDEVSDKLTFRNVHYFAAGATLFGTEVKGAYEFEGKAYNGRNLHDGEDYTTCTSCHDTHALTVDFSECQDCHEDVEEAREIRFSPEEVEPVDYDGDGDVTEPIYDEIMTFKTDLLAKIKAYAAETAGTAIAYSPVRFPYWFVDANGNGEADPDERDRYVSWTPNLLRAAYNYQYASKDPGVYIHNPDYILQVLYDSLEAIGGAEAVANYNRAPVAASGS